MVIPFNTWVCSPKMDGEKNGKPPFNNGSVQHPHESINIACPFCEHSSLKPTNQPHLFLNIEVSDVGLRSKVPSQKEPKNCSPF